ncbi:MAG: 50S ribosomal protein L29 [Rhodoferax sp.]|nr:50S ribosomal protein L29 [Rhodoferax sp.]
MSATARRTLVNTKELRQKDVTALEAEVKSLQKAHFGLRMQKATQQLNNTATLRSTRRDIARAKTILVEKQHAAKSTEGAAK